MSVSEGGEANASGIASTNPVARLSPSGQNCPAAHASGVEDCSDAGSLSCILTLLVLDTYGFHCWITVIAAPLLLNLTGAVTSS